MKELTIEVPEGYEIDTANSTFKKILFKPKSKIKTWKDLCKHQTETPKGYYVDNSSEIIKIDINYIRVGADRNIFLTKEEAISARAASMISQMMPYYGGAIKRHEWSDDNIIKYIICRDGNLIGIDYTQYNYHYLAFRTEEYRDEFLKNCEDLVRQYLMIK